MVSRDSLSSDLDLVKEVEELRLKQRLLMDSLKKKQTQEYNKQLADLSSKIDFLVEIFKNATEEEQKENDDHVDKKIDELLTKLDERFDNLESKIASVQGSSNSSVESSPKSSDSMPPPPTFHDEINDKESADSSQIKMEEEGKMKDEKGEKQGNDSDTEKSKEEVNSTIDNKLEVVDSSKKQGVFQQLKNGIKK